MITFQNDDFYYNELFFVFLASRVYSFPVFTDSFCQLFIEELDNFEQTDITKGRPNTMNKTGACYNYQLLIQSLCYIN